MAKVRVLNRTRFLSNLQAILPGMAPKGIIQQSKCVVFIDGMMVTFNGELCCRVKSGLSSKFIGGVTIKPLIDALDLLDADKIEVTATESEFIITADGDQNGMVMEQSVDLPFDKVEEAETWHKLPKAFIDGVSMVEGCASHDQNSFAKTCLQIHPKWVEAYDNKHMGRFRVKIGLKDKFLVRRDAIRHIVTLDMNEYATTENWIHFRNPVGVIYSCRKYESKNFHNLTEMINMEQETPLVFPKTIDQKIKRAENWSKENEDTNYIEVQLEPGKVRLKGCGINGWFKGKDSVRYKGDKKWFYVPPKILFELIKKNVECKIDLSNDRPRLKIDSPRFTYVTMLSTRKPKGKAEEIEE